MSDLDIRWKRRFANFDRAVDRSHVYSEKLADRAVALISPRFYPALRTVHIALAAKRS